MLGSGFLLRLTQPGQWTSRSLIITQLYCWSYELFCIYIYAVFTIYIYTGGKCTSECASNTKMKFLESLAFASVPLPTSTSQRRRGAEVGSRENLGCTFVGVPDQVKPTAPEQRHNNMYTIPPDLQQRSLTHFKPAKGPLDST